MSHNADPGTAPAGEAPRDTVRAPVNGPVLGLDLGDARIGVAVSDPERRVAVPVGTVHVGQPPGELKAIAALAQERGATLIVIGLPLSLRGERGESAAHAESFADALRGVVDVPIEMHDERRRAVDASAAAVILQAWLDGQRSNG